VKLSGKGGAVVAVAPGPAAWRRHEDALAERLTVLHGAASHALGGEPNVGVLSRVVAGDLTGAVAALTAWCADHLTSFPTGSEDATEELRAILGELHSGFRGGRARFRAACPAARGCQRRAAATRRDAHVGHVARSGL
jgi:hypothetical protein